MIVADTNLVVYLLIRGQYTPMAEAVRSNDRQWAAPPLFRHELMGVLTKYVRRGELERDRALKLYLRGLSLVRVDNFEPEPISIFNLCESSGCASFDIEFISLAMHLGVPLVTADQAVIRAFPGVTTDLTQLKT